MVFTPASNSAWQLGAGVVAEDTAKFQLYENGASAVRLEVAEGGNVTINDGNLIMGTSGHGIDFSATSNGGDSVSELLDDYEEGTFTAVWKFGTTVNTKGSDAAAWYTKVGGLVTVWVRVAISGSPSGTGTLTISGLPFTSESTSNHLTGMQIWANRIANIGDGLTAEIGTSSTSVTMQKMASSTSSDIAVISNSDCTAGSQVRFTISYRAA